MCLTLGKPSLPHFAANLGDLGQVLTFHSDLPNTVFTTAQAGIAISPHNYLSGDPSRQTSHSVHIDLSGETAVEEVYGGEEATCAYDMVSRIL